MRTDRFWHDPPLTAAGVAMATETGAKLATELKGMEHLVTVYASPSIRTIGTAAPIAAALGKPVILHKGLYCAAAAKTYGLAKCELRGPGDLMFDAAAAPATVAHPALGNDAELDARAKVRGVDLFVETVCNLVLEASAGGGGGGGGGSGGGGVNGGDGGGARGKVVIIVAHREGFSSIMERLTKEPHERIPYCGVGRFLVDVPVGDDGAAATTAASSAPLPAATRPPGSDGSAGTHWKPCAPEWRCSC